MEELKKKYSKPSHLQYVHGDLEGSGEGSQVY